eukprot:RCo037618
MSFSKREAQAALERHMDVEKPHRMLAMDTEPPSRTFWITDGVFNIGGIRERVSFSDEHATSSTTTNEARPHRSKQEPTEEPASAPRATARPRPASSSLPPFSGAPSARSSLPIRAARDSREEYPSSSDRRRDSRPSRYAPYPSSSHSSSTRRDGSYGSSSSHHVVERKGGGAGCLRRVTSKGSGIQITRYDSRGSR